MEPQVDAFINILKITIPMNYVDKLLNLFVRSPCLLTKGSEIIGQNISIIIIPKPKWVILSHIEADVIYFIHGQMDKFRRLVKNIRNSILLVAPPTSGFLDITFYGRRVVNVNGKADIWFVNTHTKGLCGYHNIHVIIIE